MRECGTSSLNGKSCLLCIDSSLAFLSGMDAHEVGAFQQSLLLLRIEAFSRPRKAALVGAMMDLRGFLQVIYGRHE